MKHIVCFVAGLLAAPVAAAAADLPFPTVSFTGEAKYCVVADGREECVTTLMFYSPERWRVEQTDRSRRTVQLVDFTKKTLTVIEFAEKASLTMPFDAKAEETYIGYVRLLADHERVGEEAIGGVATIKYKVSKTELTLRMEGFAWIGADNIVRRMHVKLTDPVNKVNSEIKFEAIRITVGPVDAASLDVAIPTDFRQDRR
jgi:hypothetical protein